MEIDIVYHGAPATAHLAARKAEETGFYTFWVPETKHDPFLSILKASETTSSIRLGTAVAVGLARSPMTLAQTAWDLATLTQGRFLLGLGSQIKAHIVRRFGMTWDKPVAQMRELILALRAIWNSFQTGERLQFKGRYYDLNLLPPFFNPGPIEHPSIPIGLAAVGPAMTRLAGELADFVILHPFTNTHYLAEVTIPALEDGLSKADRDPDELCVIGSVFAITGDKAGRESLKSQAKNQIAFYGSTPNYKKVLECIGYGELHEQLYALSKQGAWSEMERLISDELLDHFCVTCSEDELPEVITQKYGPFYDRAILTLPLAE